MKDNSEEWTGETMVEISERELYELKKEIESLNSRLEIKQSTIKLLFEKIGRGTT